MNWLFFFFFFFILKLYILMNPSNSMKVYGLIAHFKYPILFFFSSSLKGNIFETLSIRYRKISMPCLRKRMKETWDAAFFSNIGGEFVCLQQDFCFMSFCCFFIAVLVTFRGPDLIKCQKIQEKIECFGSNQLHIMLEDRRYSWKHLLLIRGQKLNFPLILDLNIDFQYLIIKKTHFHMYF